MRVDNFKNTIAIAFIYLFLDVDFLIEETFI